MASETKFVSNIPNNKLEPVYLGGTQQTNSTAKTNGVFVPSCLRTEKDTKVQMVPQVNEQTFPSLLGATIKASKPFLGYANAVKKPAVQIVKPVASSNSVNTSVPKVSKKQYSEYSDSDNESSSEDNDTFLDDQYKY